MVNHRRNFVNPIRYDIEDNEGNVHHNVEIHTQNVERYNRELKAYIKKFHGTASKHREELVMEATFRVQFRDLDWDQAIANLIKGDYQALWDLTHAIY